MTDLQMLGNSFCEFGLVSTYHCLVHLFWNNLLSKDSGPAALVILLVLACVLWLVITSFSLYFALFSKLLAFLFFKDKFIKKKISSDKKQTKN